MEITNDGENLLILNSNNNNINNNNIYNNNLKTPLIMPANIYPPPNNQLIQNQNIENFLDERYKKIILSSNSFFVSRGQGNYYLQKMMGGDLKTIDCFPIINGIKTNVPIIQIEQRDFDEYCCCDLCFCCYPHYNLLMGINYCYFDGLIAEKQFFSQLISDNNQCCCKSCCKIKPIVGEYLDNNRTSFGQIIQIDSQCNNGNLHIYEIYDKYNKLEYLLKYKTKCKRYAILEDVEDNLVGKIENVSFCKNFFSYNVTFPPNSSFEMRCLLLSLVLKVDIDLKT